MCDRYTSTDPDRVAEAMLRDFGVVLQTEVPRYNIGPAQMVPIIRSDESDRPAGEQIKWGLVPFWDKSEKPKIAPINARSEICWPYASLTPRKRWRRTECRRW